MAYTGQSSIPRIASSIYSVPACEAIDRAPRPFTSIAGRNSSNDVNTHATEHRQALRKLTESGKGLYSDGVFREPGSDTPIKSRPRHPRYHRPSIDDQTGTIDNREQTLDPSQCRTPMRIMLRDGTIHSADTYRPGNRPNISMTKAVAGAKKDQATQTSRTFGGGPVPPRLPALPAERLPMVKASERRYVRPDAEQHLPTRRPSLVRKLSNSIKTAFRRRGSIDKHDISRPSNFQDHHPNHYDKKVLHSDIKAVPIVDAQSRAHSFEMTRNDAVAGSECNCRREMPLRRFDSGRVIATANPDSQSSSARSSADRAVRRKQTFTSLQEARKSASNVRVVGDPTRGTLFGDFIEGTKARKQIKVDNISATKPLPPVPLNECSQPNLVPEPLRVPSTRSDTGCMRNRAPRKRVDPSTKSWMPPEPRMGHRRFKSEGDEPETAFGHDVQIHNNVRKDTPDMVDDIIEAYATKSRKASPVKLHTDVHGLQQESAIRYHSENTREETFVDTFDRGSHLSWMATCRQRSKDDGRSDCNQFDENVYDQCIRGHAANGLSNIRMEEFVYI